MLRLLSPRLPHCSRSSPASPTLLVLQDLLDTLKVCAATEVSLTADAPANGSTAAAATAAPLGETAASPQRRALPHQRRSRDDDVRPDVGARDEREVEGPEKDCTKHGDSDEILEAEDAAGEVKVASATAGGDGGRRGSQAATGRTAEVGARAQELAAARFAGMRSAAEAKSAAAAAAASAASGDGTPLSGDTPVSRVASSFGKGVYKAFNSFGISSVIEGESF